MCFQHILQILRTFNMWLLKYELWNWTAHNDRKVNIQMHNITWQMITLLCCVCYDEKQTETYFSDYYKAITHVQKHKVKCII